MKGLMSLEEFRLFIREIIARNMKQIPILGDGPFLSL